MPRPMIFICSEDSTPGISGGPTVTLAQPSDNFRWGKSPGAPCFVVGRCPRRISFDTRSRASSATGRIDGGPRSPPRWTCRPNGCCVRDRSTALRWRSAPRFQASSATRTPISSLPTIRRQPCRQMADCVRSPRRQVTGAVAGVHAGWRGTAARAVQAARRRAARCFPRESRRPRRGDRTVRRGVCCYTVGEELLMPSAARGMPNRTLNVGS